MSASNPMKIAFLLGAGISIPAKMPSTKSITDRVLSGKSIMHHTDGSYLLRDTLDANNEISDEYTSRIPLFLKRLKLEIDLYYLYQPWRFTNYEDLYYVATQIKHSESREYDNPVLQSFIDKILPSLRPLLVGKRNETRKEWQLGELARESIHYIRDIVWHMLTIEPSRTDHLECIMSACLDNRLSGIDLFTLNHDTVLERCLSQKGIHIIDGFCEPENEVRYWDADLYEKGTSKVRLLKLHGSVNWFRFRANGGDWGDESIGIPLAQDHWHTENPQGQMQLPIDGRPLFLAGSFNKIWQYTSGIYSELHCQLYRSLRHTQRLVVGGYGFGDKGINTQILDWIYSIPDRKIILIHPEPKELKKSARGAISRKWDGWKKQNKLIILPKRIEETSWDDLRNELFKNEE